MYNNLIDNIILSITREDEHNTYDVYSPLGLYFDFGVERGLYIRVRNENAVVMDLITRVELIETSGFEYSECDLNELKEDDELKKLIGKKIKEIKIAVNKDSKIKGDTFELLLEGYAGIKIKTVDDEVIFYNENGGYLIINGEGKITNKGPWTWV